MLTDGRRESGRDGGGGGVTQVLPQGQGRMSIHKTSFAVVCERTAGGRQVHCHLRRRCCCRLRATTARGALTVRLSQTDTTATQQREQEERQRRATGLGASGHAAEG